MTKKLLSRFIILTILLTSLFGQAIFAFDEGSKDVIEVSNFDIKQIDAEKVAALFLLSDLVNNQDTQWDNSCKISSINPLYDLDNNTTAYDCKVVKGDQDKGYIIVSASSSLNPIVEYSYESTTPTDYLNTIASSDSKSHPEKTYYLGNQQYYVGIKEKNNKVEYKSILKQKIDKKDLKKHFNTTKEFENINKEKWESIKKIDRKSINELFVVGGSENTYANVISDPVTYLKNMFGQSNSYTLYSSKNLSNVGNWLQKDYETTDGVGATTGSSVNNCTLSSVANIMLYYSANGYSKIPLDRIKIYNSFRQRAVLLGYNPTDGISVTYADDLVGEAFKSFGYTDGSGSNNYAWSFAVTEANINNGRPSLFNLASNPYYNHTVAVKGYVIYKNGTSSYHFFTVRDNWNYGDRYISDQEFYLGCMTSITPPSSKT